MHVLCCSDKVPLAIVLMSCMHVEKRNDEISCIHKSLKASAALGRHESFPNLTLWKLQSAICSSVESMWKGNTAHIGNATIRHAVKTRCNGRLGFVLTRAEVIK